MKHLKRFNIILLGIVLVVAIVCAAVGINAGDTTKKIRIIYTNDTLGYVEPCGWGGHKQGGLARRSTELAILTKENPNSIIVESGNIVRIPNNLDMVTTILANLKYDAIGVGEQDSNIGDEYYKQTSAKKLKVLDAAPGANSSTIPYTIKKVNGVNVGIVSFGAVKPEYSQNTYTMKRAMYGAYKEAREKSDILILLDQANIADRDWLNHIGAKLGPPDVIVGGTLRMIVLQDEIVGKTHIVPTSVDGKAVGVVDIEYSSGQDIKVATRKIDLDEKVAEDEVIIKMVKAASANTNNSNSYYPPNTIPAIGSQSSVVVSDGKPYYSAESCKTCHVRQYDDWKTTKHAQAIKTLVAINKATPECLMCHSESYRRNNGVVTQTDGPSGVECASCHIAVLPHGMERRNVTLKASVDKDICLNCHNIEHSPNYNEEKYLSKVSHISIKSNGVAENPHKN